MARTLVVEVAVTVQNDEQAALIFEAVGNGMAETAIKERVLFGVQPSLASSSTVAADSKAQAKAAEAEKTFTPIGPTVGSAPVKVIEKEKTPRARGVMGRTKIGRTGGNRG